jgi:penicillin-binding protein 1A
VTSGRRPRPRPRKAQRWLWRYRRLVFLVGLLVATGVAGLIYVLFHVPLPRAPDLAQTTLLSDAEGRPLAELHGGQNRVSVALDRVPPVLRQAVVAVEDRNFFTHRGVDPVGLARATWADIRNRAAVQGGSTITQQYVKNTFVGRERTLWRKLREAVISLKLEREVDKELILERYLNTIYFGRGAYGVQAASQAYFGLDVSELSLKEAAYLAGLIRRPETADASRDPEEARVRRRSTLRAMERAGYIEGTARRTVERIPVDSYVLARPPTAEATVHQPESGTHYFVEYVRQFLVRRYGERAVYGGGLRVRTSIDLRLQAAAYDAVHDVLDRPDDPAGALVALDANGSVRAMIGGRSWNLSKVNLAVGRDGGGRGRQGGSAFKPFVLAEAVRAGYTVESSLPAPAEVVLPKANRGRDWKVSNYEKAEYGTINLIDATKHSVNTVYAQLVTAVGPGRVAELARELGIESPLAAVPSITLGTQDVSVLEMTNAYLTFANRGIRAEPHVVLEVTNAEGELIERFDPRRRRVLERSHADVVNFILRQVVEGGTGTAAAFGKPFAGKTGTTQGFGDAWFVGYTPAVTAAVWMGYPEGQARAMVDVHGRKVNGGSFPAEIFRRFMKVATAGLDIGSFPALSSFPGRAVKSQRIKFASTTTTKPSETKPSETTTTGPPTTAGPATTTTPTTAGPGTTAPPPATTAPPTTRAAPSTTRPPPTATTLAIRPP